MFPHTERQKTIQYENKIEANYKDGVLHVTILKKADSRKKTTKRIDIK